jgi:hypothetical protein
VFLRPGLFLMGDVAYVNDERCKTGYKAPQLDPARVGAAEAARRRLYNQHLSALRIRVEHAFSSSQAYQIGLLGLGLLGLLGYWV